MRSELSIINNLEDKERDISQNDDESSLKDSSCPSDGEENGPKSFKKHSKCSKEEESLSSLESLSEISYKQEEFEEKVINKSKKKISVIFQVQDTQQVIKKKKI